MSYETQQITKSLRERRLAKGISQTDLSKLSGVPQAQISRIEANTVDLRLSSLVAIAHALDMEVTLAPRKAMPAIRSITRQTTEHAPFQPSAIGKELQRLQDTIRSVQIRVPQFPYLEELRKAHAAIQPLKIDTSHLASLRDIRSTIEQATASQEQWKTVTEAVRNMQLLRNQITHASLKTETRDMPRPAYTLDEDDDA